MSRIVVVDDDDDIRMLVMRRLERAGHTVIEAADGEAALATITAEDPDLVVLDWMMPRLDGMEVLARLRAADAERPRVLMLTARALGAELDRARAAGADALLVKPFTAADLLGAVADLLGE
jgi:two-component system phosphate regulon response regulator PhoB